MIDAYKAGVPGNGKPFPEGSQRRSAAGGHQNRLATGCARDPSCSTDNPFSDLHWVSAHGRLSATAALETDFHSHFGVGSAESAPRSIFARGMPDNPTPGTEDFAALAPVDAHALNPRWHQRRFARLRLNLWRPTSGDAPEWPISSDIAKRYHPRKPSHTYAEKRRTVWKPTRS
jgi:hypothetical protein